MDLETGKRIFYLYNGSTFFIDREVGSLYKKCKVPVEIEQTWRKDIIDTLKRKVAISKGKELVSSTIGLTQLLQDNDALGIFKSILARKDLDTFTRLIICEMLKERFKKSEQFTKEILKRNQLLMMENLKTVDSSYKKDPRFKNYNFRQSFENRLPLLTQ